MDPVVSAGRIEDEPVSRSRGRDTPSVDGAHAFAGAHARRLPGGGRFVELWSGHQRLTLAASGDIDSFDVHAVIDVLTDGILRGARQIRVDARHVTFCDIAVLRALLRVDRFLGRSGGSLTVTGLRRPLDLAWALVQSTEAERSTRPIAACSA